MAALANANKVPSMGIVNFGGETFYWSLEDMSGFFLLEDGSGRFLLEEA